MTLPNVSSPKILVIQPLPGIGDAIWHLPHIRALAKRAAGGKVTLLTKSRTAARTWLHHDPALEEILYLEGARPLMGLKLRSYGFDEAWIFHNSTSYAVMAALAGIQKRIGPGYEWAQRVLLSNHPLPKEAFNTHHIDQMTLLMQQQGEPIDSQDTSLSLDAHALDYIQDHYGALDTPWVTFGIGASEDWKQWPLESYLPLAEFLTQEGARSFFICGSLAEREKVRVVVAALKSKGLAAIGIDHLNLSRVFALLSRASLFVGNDSSLLNASACLGVPSVGLFGATTPLRYSSHMHGVSPPEGSFGLDGMRAITPQNVITLIKEKNLLTNGGRLNVSKCL